MEYRNSDTYAIYKNIVYRLGLNNDGIDFLIGINESNTPVIKINRSDIKVAYITRVWIKVKGCKTILLRKQGEYFYVSVKPSDDIKILGAKEVDRGVFEVIVNKREIEQIWEARSPLNGFEFPKGMNTIEEIDLKTI